MSSEIADLYVALRADTAPMTAAFAEGGAAGDEMATAVVAATTEMQAAFLRTAEGVTALTGATDTVAADIATVMRGAGITVDEFGATTATSAAEVEAAEARIQASFAATAASADRMAEQYYLDAEGIKAKTMSLSAGMAAAEADAAAGMEALSAAMAGTAVETDAAAAGVAKAGGLMSQVMFGVKLGVAAAGVESIKMAADFQSSTERLVTSAGEIQSNVNMVRSGILNMAGQVGYSAAELSKAMYTVESGGQHGAAGLKVLQAAAEGAKTENAQLETVADAVTSVLQDYHLKADDAATVTSKLVAATSQGKTTFEQLAGSMSAVLPVASANHVSLNDILGDLASMTVHGMSAQQAAQNLTDAIRHMASPTMAQSKELAALGLNATEVSKNLGQQGLSGTIQDIAQRIQAQMGPAGLVVVNLTNALKGLPPPVQKLGQEVLNGTTTLAAFTKEAKGLDPISGKQAQSFAALAGSMHTIGTESKSGAEVYQTYAGSMQKAMGDATGLNVALMLTGENSKTTANAISVVSSASQEAGGHVKGWSEIQQTFNQKWSEFKDGLGALAITIGSVLLPAVGDVLSAFMAVGKFLGDHKVLLIGIGTVIAVALVPSLIAAALATWAWTAALLANPLTWIALLVAGLAMGVYELVTHWSTVAKFFEDLWGHVKDAFGTAIHWIGDRLGEFAGFFERIPGEIGGFLSSLGSTIVSGLSRAWDWITTPFREAFDAVKAFFSQSPAEMGAELGRAAGKITLAVVNFCKKVGQDFTTGLDQIKTGIVTFFTSTLPNFFTQTIPNFAKKVGTDLLNAGKSMLKSIGDGFKQGWQNEVTFWTKTFPQFFTQTIPNTAKRIGTDLLNAGKSVLKSLGDGFRQGWQNEVSFWTNLPGEIKGFFVAAPGWLLQAGKDILSGFWNGITSFVSTIYNGIKDFITSFINGFKQGLGVASPSTITANIGRDVVQGLWNGVKAAWGGFIGFVRGLPGDIVRGIGDLGHILYAAGAACMQGLYNGFVSVWNSVSGWLSQVGGWIANLKGPLDKDRQLLQPHGNAIIQGLMDGMKAQMPALQSHLNDVTKTITSLNGTAGATIGVKGFSSPTALGSGTVNTFNFVVQGNVHTTKDLATDLITEFQKRGIRNTGSGLTYGFATGR